MWYAKPLLGYLRDSTEAISNATEMKTFLMAHNWTLNAVCAMIGNIGYEGGYNPWRWENDWRDGASAIMTKQFAYTATFEEARTHGYGMFGFTPPKNYCNITSETYSGYAPNFSDEAGNATDGQAQTYWVTQHPEQFQNVPPYSPYPESLWTYSYFTTSTQNVQLLAEVWCYNWEKPADPSASLAGRKDEAQYWWDYFEGGPTPPPPPPPRPRKKFKWWMYMPPPRPMPF